GFQGPIPASFHFYILLLNTAVPLGFGSGRSLGGNSSHHEGRPPVSSFHSMSCSVSIRWSMARLSSGPNLRLFWKERPTSRRDMLPPSRFTLLTISLHNSPNSSFSSSMYS